MRRTWSNLATISILGFVLIVSLGFLSLQTSRLESCRRTYQSFPAMFKPFFPTDQSKWTVREQRDWNKLISRANLLSSHCDDQIKPYLFH